MSVLRFDGYNFIDPTSHKRYDGSNWIDVENEKRYDGSKWVSVYVRGTQFYLKIQGVNTSSIHITNSSDGTLNFYGTASLTIPTVTVMVDTLVSANKIASITATCSNQGNLPTVYLGFKQGLKEVSKKYDGVLNSSSNTLSSENLTPTVASYPYAQFMVKTQQSIGSSVGFTIRLEVIMSNSVLLPKPYYHNPVKDIIENG